MALQEYLVKKLAELEQDLARTLKASEHTRAKMAKAESMRGGDPTSETYQKWNQNVENLEAEYDKQKKHLAMLEAEITQKKRKLEECLAKDPAESDSPAAAPADTAEAAPVPSAQVAHDSGHPKPLENGERNKVLEAALRKLADAHEDTLTLEEFRILLESYGQLTGQENTAAANVKLLDVLRMALARVNNRYMDVCTMWHDLSVGQTPP